MVGTSFFCQRKLPPLPHKKTNSRYKQRGNPPDIFIFSKLGNVGLRNTNEITLKKCSTQKMPRRNDIRFTWDG